MESPLHHAVRTHIQAPLLSCRLRSSPRFVLEGSTDLEETWLETLDALTRRPPCIRAQEQSKSHRNSIVGGAGNVGEANMAPPNNSSPQDKILVRVAIIQASLCASVYYYSYLSFIRVLWPADERHSFETKPATALMLVGRHTTRNVQCGNCWKRTGWDAAECIPGRTLTAATGGSPWHFRGTLHEVYLDVLFCSVLFCFIAIPLL
ncbi:hypothetical protein V8C34DRAFT_249949 [Trichoderma compactum]